MTASVPRPPIKAVLLLLVATALTATLRASAQPFNASNPLNSMYRAQARLFIADVDAARGCNIIAVDLPSYSVHKVGVPPAASMVLKLVDAGKHLLVFLRSSSSRGLLYGPNDLQYMPVVSTGLDMNPASLNGARGRRLMQTTRNMSRAVLSKTLTLGSDMYGAAWHPSWNRYVIMAEDSGTFYLFPKDALRAVAGWSASTFTVGHGHFYTIPWQTNAIIMNTDAPVRLYTRDGRVLREWKCERAHGNGVHTATGWTKAVIGCGEGVLVISSEGTSEMLATPPPPAPRAGNFLAGPKGSGIFWAYGTQAATYYRVDVSKRQENSLATRPSSGAPIAWARSPDGSFFFALDASGILAMHDGNTGAIVNRRFRVPGNVTDSQRIPPYMETYRNQVLLTIAHTGTLHFIRVNYGAKAVGPIVKSIRLGGLPTRMVLADPSNPDMAKY